MSEDRLPPHPDHDPDHERPCPECGAPMRYTGLPDLAGPVHFRFYRCPKHGVVRVGLDEDPQGWG